MLCIMKKLSAHIVLILLVFCSCTWADEKAPIRSTCIVPSMPGGGFDATCRLIAESSAAAQLLPSRMLVHYLPGGVGVVAFNRYAYTTPDMSNTIIAVSTGSLVLLALGRFGEHANPNDVQWIGAIGQDVGVMVVHPESAIHTLEQLAQSMRQNDPIVFGGSGSLGSQDWLKIALLAKEIQVNPLQIRYVPQESGGEGMSALLGKHIDVFSGDLSNVSSLVESNKVRVLAIFSDETLAAPFDKLPTAKQQGFNLVRSSFRGVYAPGKIEKASIDFWTAFITRLSNTPEFKKRQAQYGFLPLPLTGVAFKQYVMEQYKETQELVKWALSYEQ